MRALPSVSSGMSASVPSNFDMMPFPHRSSNSVMPMLQESAAKPQYSSVKTTSGAMYGMVPAFLRQSVPASWTQAWSQSTNFNSGSSSMGRTRKLAGRISP
eukprot:CAMPEP_0172891030 /NCGR_PEP_ID=MMETSP1075-20121228/142803_1 /TAXON_ID=2916 /ORGANISM="Ceratium fusus, Strain PA161109" /LENGTH=100 /DNA_ID=CAMNT_0013745409 /DNA_START=159 /DNA_END=461 /DNA_ORIENTATION=+